MGENMNKYISDTLLTPRNIKRIGVDFDDSLAKKIYPEKGIGDPLPGAREAMYELQSLGYKIVIYSARPDADEIAIELWCLDHDIPFNKIKLGKPLFLMYIGDEAFHLTDWKKDLKKIKKRLRGDK